MPRIDKEIDVSPLLAPNTRAWHLRVAPLYALGAPQVVITDHTDHEDNIVFNGSEEAAFTKLAEALAEIRLSATQLREVQTELGKLKDETEQLRQSISSQRKQGSPAQKKN